MLNAIWPRWPGWPVPLIVVPLAVAALTSCLVLRARAEPGQLDRGRPVYEASCATATCHKADGSSSPPQIWPSVGAAFQQRNPNAQAVFDVVRSGEEPNLLALGDQQIYDAIAWELSLNGVDLPQELTAANAASVATGPAAVTQPGAIYPPLDITPPGAPPASPAPFLGLPPAPSPGTAATPGPSASNGRVGLRVDQVGYVDRLGSTQAPPGSVFAVVVLFVDDRAGSPLQTDRPFLRATDSTGATRQPSATKAPSAIDNYHARTLTPGKGLAGIVAFEIPAGSRLASLAYDDGQTPPLEVPLA